MMHITFEAYQLQDEPVQLLLYKKEEHRQQKINVILEGLGETPELASMSLSSLNDQYTLTIFPCITQKDRETMDRLDRDHDQAKKGKAGSIPQD